MKKYVEAVEYLRKVLDQAHPEWHCKQALEVVVSHGERIILTSIISEKEGDL